MFHKFHTPVFLLCKVNILVYTAFNCEQKIKLMEQIAGQKQELCKILND